MRRPQRPAPAQTRPGRGRTGCPLSGRAYSRGRRGSQGGYKDFFMCVEGRNAADPGADPRAGLHGIVSHKGPSDGDRPVSRPGGLPPARSECAHGGAPVFLRRRRVRPSYDCPRNARETARQAAQPVLVRAPCGARRLSARRRGVLTPASGRAFVRSSGSGSSAGSRRGLVVAPGGAPTPPGCRVTNPARRRRTRSAISTSLDDVPQRAGD